MHKALKLIRASVQPEIGHHILLIDQAWLLVFSLIFSSFSWCWFLKYKWFKDDIWSMIKKRPLLSSAKQVLESSHEQYPVGELIFLGEGGSRFSTSNRPFLMKNLRKEKTICVGPFSNEVSDSIAWSIWFYSLKLRKKKINMMDHHSRCSTNWKEVEKLLEMRMKHTLF